MLTILEIDQYVDSCVNRFKENYQNESSFKQDFDFLMFKCSPSFSYFETKYERIEVSRETKVHLINMNERYNNRCLSWKSEQ